ncbi:hypothetical protein AcdelDRAFT_0022 [Acidovorax delafieldii 2AN]|uniref:Uncharacterized protein n=1 Tax=Acidovorax delafieldii 2AN TaxID=573060 RepID=C5SZE2_ACIDE|nr:hypothetical protein AcdelDRAFT_0022 [Acidovorax delafieldii 2AN]
MHVSKDLTFAQGQSHDQLSSRALNVEPMAP